MGTMERELCDIEIQSSLWLHLQELGQSMEACKVACRKLPITERAFAFAGRVDTQRERGGFESQTTRQGGRMTQLFLRCRWRTALHIFISVTST